MLQSVLLFIIFAIFTIISFIVSIDIDYKQYAFFLWIVTIIFGIMFFLSWLNII
jgi:hypothetical protein